MKTSLLATLMLSGACLGLCADNNVSPLWQEFVAAKKSGSAATLPDFSYAGFKQGTQLPQASGKVFNVTDFGAIPDDMNDDLEAIARAVKAAELNGGGIVFLPRGRYLVNTDMNKRSTIKITSSNITIKGEGCRDGGTIIHAIHPYGGGDPHKLSRLHLGDNVFLAYSPNEEKSFASRPDIAKVTANASPGSFSVTVDSSAQLKPGQSVLLHALNKDIFTSMVAPYSIEPKWTTITENKAPAVEIHRISSISGNTVNFSEPIRYTIQSGHGWTLKDFQPIANVGFEDICFMGNAYHDYVHHRSGYDDSGWAFIKMKSATDSWIRNCAFINCSQTAYVALSSYVSIINIFIDGNKGHHIPRSVYFNYGLFGGLILDRAGYDHGPSLSWGSVGTVFWRCTSNGSLDSHAGRPFTSLFDLLRGGRINSSGGLRDYPQHLRDLVVWNFYNTDTSNPHYDFWVKDKNNRFVKPIFVGFHGEPATFNPDSLQILESQGKPVLPESLFEAQLALRLGNPPAWIEQVKTEHLKLAAQQPPAHFNRNVPGSSPLIFTETFKTQDMLKYLCSLSLQMFNSKQFSYKVDDNTPAITTDQNLLRNTLYSVMNSIYQHNKDNNSIHVTSNNPNSVTFTLQSGVLRKSTPPNVLNDHYLKSALLYASFIDAKITQHQHNSKIIVDISIPTMYNKQ